MKIIRDDINRKSGEGFVKLEPIEEEDIYYLYNLIGVGDSIETITVRNVVAENKSGAKNKTRVQFKITIEVEKIEFDAEQCSLRLNGKNICENDHIKMFQYHTVEIELKRTLTLTKQSWDSVSLEILGEASNPLKNADVAAITMHDGLANICLIKSNMTKVLKKIERPFPKKRDGAQYDNTVELFLGDVYNAVNSHIDFDRIKALLIGSPGFLNEDFYNYMIRKATTDDCTDILKNKSKCIRVHTSVGHLKAIDEMLGNEQIAVQLSDVKAAGEVKALSRFHDMMASDADRVCYGFDSVVSAHEQLAIDELLITDTLYRTQDFDKRKIYIALLESVLANGGKVFKFSAMHVSGQNLDLYTGIAATLRFPIPEVAEEIPRAEDDIDDFEACKKTYDQITAEAASSVEF